MPTSASQRLVTNIPVHSSAIEPSGALRRLPQRLPHELRSQVPPHHRVGCYVRWEVWHSPCVDCLTRDCLWLLFAAALVLVVRVADLLQVRPFCPLRCPRRVSVQRWPRGKVPASHRGGLRYYREPGRVARMRHRGLLRMAEQLGQMLRLRDRRIGNAP
jgi:hypothetical protein